jgi:hypothetical protein
MRRRVRRQRGEDVMVSTLDHRHHEEESFDVYSRDRVLAVVLMFVVMLGASSLRHDVISSFRERLALLQRADVDTGWIPVDGVMRTSTYPDSLEPTGPDTYRFVLRYRLASSYYAHTHEEVDCRRRMTRVIRSRRQGIRNDSIVIVEPTWSAGRRDGVTQRKLEFLCRIVAPR